MRMLPMIVLLLGLGFCLPAAAQTLNLHQGTPANNKPVASAIIPGSPLAALTGAAPANQEAVTPAPFGTNGIGIAPTSELGTEFTRTVVTFVMAIQHSTRLQPVVEWLQGFSADPARRSYLIDILMAMVIAVLPALTVEAVIRLALRRPRVGLAAKALPKTRADAPDELREDAMADAEAGATEKLPRRKLPDLAWFRRLGFALVNLGMLVIPLIGFALTVQLAISAGFITTRPAHLAMVGIANAYLTCRLAQEIARFAVAPVYPSLRLFAMPTARSIDVMLWVGVLLATGFVTFTVVSVAEVLGISHEGALVLLRLFVLVLHIEVAMVIWRSRKVVGVWIGGRPGAQSGWARIRRRFGAVWYIPALFYILALWIALAAGVHDAFSVLLRVVLVFLGGMFLGRVAWLGSTVLLERALPDPSMVNARHPALAARARAYNPLVRLLIQLMISMLVILLILQGWGVNAIGWLLTDRVSRSLVGAFVSVILTIALALVLWECTNYYISARIDRLAASGRTRQASRLRTLLPMIKAAIGVVLTLVAFYVCMTKIGVNAAPLFASFGVLSIAIAFGSQKLVQDIITGLFLLLEDAIRVGDVVSLGGMTGTVEWLSVRTIRLRGGDGSVNIIPFSAVTTVTNMTRDFGYAQISIQVAYEEDLNHVAAVLKDIATKMRAEPGWSAMIRDDLQLFGLDEFGASALVITGQIRTGPGQHWAVRREFYARVKARFEAEHIEMPYTYLPPAPPRVPDAGGSKQGQGALPGRAEGAPES